MPVSATPPDTWAEFCRVRARFGAPVAEAYARAEGYVWGWQDAMGPDASDTDQATQFAEAWAIHYAQHLAAPGRPVRSIDRCWRSWLDCGHIAPPSQSLPTAPPTDLPPAVVRAVRAVGLFAAGARVMWRWARPRPPQF